MIVSMTGYGRAQRTAAFCEITVELRSVNHRYLDCSVRTPRLHAYLEDPVKALVQQAASRGKIDVFITVEHKPGSDLRVSLNRPVLEGYLAAARVMHAEYGLEDDLTVARLARFPDVFAVEKDPIGVEELTREVTEAAREAVEGFMAMRRREGERLEEDILVKLGAIEELIVHINERSPQTVADYRARLEAKMKEVLAGTGVDEARLLTEAALFSDRVAVDEETVRLTSHIAELRALLKKGGAVGRKLDFLLQEFNREANTIGSKALDADMARAVVDLKSEIEKIREQVQNIE